MVPYCPTILSGGTCTDAECPNGHDIYRCEPCNCTFPTPWLEKHQSGKKHLRNVASNRLPISGGPQQPTSQPGLPNAQSVPPPSTLPPSSGSVPTHAADPRVIVSDEGGLDFTVEGSINAGNPSFSSADIIVSITKTAVLSSLSVNNVVVAPIPNSDFSASLVGNAQEVRQKTPRSIRVSFHASRAGNFHGSLMITFIDRTRRNDREFTVTRELRGHAILPGGPASNGEASETVTGLGFGPRGEGTGISISPESGLEFLVERPRSDVPFSTQTLQLVISKSSPKRLVSFKAARLRSLDESVTA
ncbi:hypothetical protein BJV78DRAFT_204673 [Lactifluus subvellereus]|nr:hypothetical protein BJV78DRAFT_204673 [Lactifluus subvellereus]